MIDLSSVKDIEIEERQKDSEYIYISILIYQKGAKGLKSMGVRSENHYQ